MDTETGDSVVVKTVICTTGEASCIVVTGTRYDPDCRNVSSYIKGLMLTNHRAIEAAFQNLLWRPCMRLLLSFLLDFIMAADRPSTYQCLLEIAKWALNKTMYVESDDSRYFRYVMLIISVCQSP